MPNNDPMSKWIKVVEDGDAMLTEMANSRKDAADAVIGLSETIFGHLLKLFVFESPTTVNHWIAELDGWFKRIADIRLKPDGRLVSKVDIYNWLTSKPDGQTTKFTADSAKKQVSKWRNGKYKSVKARDVDLEFVVNKILSIIKFASIEAATGKFDSIRPYVLEEQ